MEYIFIYTFMVYGLSAALVYYKGPWGIIEKFREHISSNRYLDELFSCMFCLPVNIGIVLSVLSLILSGFAPFTPFTIIFHNHIILWPIAVLFDAFYAGSVVSIIDSIVDSISTKYGKINNDNETNILFD